MIWSHVMIDKENVLFSEYGIANVTLQVGTIDSLGNEKKKRREEIVCASTWSPYMQYITYTY